MSVAALLRTRVRDCGHTLNMTGVELLDNDCLDLVQCLIDKNNSMLAYALRSYYQRVMINATEVMGVTASHPGANETIKQQIACANIIRVFQFLERLMPVCRNLDSEEGVAAEQLHDLDKILPEEYTKNVSMPRPPVRVEIHASICVNAALQRLLMWQHRLGTRSLHDREDIQAAVRHLQELALNQTDNEDECDAIVDAMQRAVDVGGDACMVPSNLIIAMCPRLKAMADAVDPEKLKAKEEAEREQNLREFEAEQQRKMAQRYAGAASQVERGATASYISRTAAELARDEVAESSDPFGRVWPKVKWPKVAIPLPRLTPRSFELTSAHIPEIEPLRNLILESPTNAQSTGLMKQLFPHHKKTGSWSSTGARASVDLTEVPDEAVQPVDVLSDDDHDDDIRSQLTRASSLSRVNSMHSTRSSRSVRTRHSVLSRPTSMNVKFVDEDLAKKEAERRQKETERAMRAAEAGQRAFGLARIPSNQIPNNPVQIRTLVLEQAGITDLGAAALASVLRQNAAFQALLQIHQLAGDANPFVDLLGHDDEVRTRAFRSKLGLCGSIRELRLWGNRIGDEGAIQLAHAIQFSASLQVLYLHHNRIGDIGAESLATALTENTSLTFLDLHANRIKDSGASALATAISTDQSVLEVLYLHENHVGVSGARDMKAALLHNKSLKVYSGPGSDNTKEFRKWDESEEQETWHADDGPLAGMSASRTSDIRKSASGHCLLM